MSQAPAAQTGENAAGSDPGHRFFRPVLAFFIVFVALQISSGFVLYVWKIGLDPALTLEYYAGSEVMLEYYPERPDRFMQPRSFAGLTKIAVGQLLAYGTIAFILTHLVRSLAGKPSRRLEAACTALYALALLEIVSGYLVVYAPLVGPPLRTLIFVLFEAAMAGFLVILIALARAKARPAGAVS